MSSHLVLQMPVKHLRGVQRHLYVQGFLLKETGLQKKMTQLLLPCIYHRDVFLPATMLLWAGLNLVFA